MRHGSNDNDTEVSPIELLCFWLLYIFSHALQLT
jgi:hypothetical protein